MTGKKLPWWHGLDVVLGHFHRNDITTIAKAALTADAVNEGGTVYELSDDGNLVNNKEAVIKRVKDMGGRCVTETIETASSTGLDKLNEDLDAVYVWDDSILYISINDDWIRVVASTLNKALANDFKKLISDEITHKVKGRAYVFVSTADGPELRQVQGKSGVKLERDNYPEDVVADFDHIVSELKKPKPCGRLVIIDGEPGTGKTYFVRGISEEVDDAIFILIHPAMMAEVMGPEFVTVLMDYHEKGKPIVFIVEDADSCLVERQADNMTSISALLQLGDGIFGSLFDIRILATTNAKKMDMDPAIMRPRRLCRRIEIGELDMEQANKAFKKLVTDESKELPFKKGGYTLAEVYAAADDDGNKKEPDSESKVKKGFGFTAG